MIKQVTLIFPFRPELGFNVELLDTIDIDAFGIDKIISDVIEDVLSKREPTSQLFIMIISVSKTSYHLVTVIDKMYH